VPALTPASSASPTVTNSWAKTFDRKLARILDFTLHPLAQIVHLCHGAQIAVPVLGRLRLGGSQGRRAIGTPVELKSGASSPRAD